MQAIKEKLHGLSGVHNAKVDPREEEKAEKEPSKAKVEVAHEMKKAKEAEAKMELHMAKTGQKAQKEIAKHNSSDLNQPPDATTATAAAADAAASNPRNFTNNLL